MTWWTMILFAGGLGGALLLLNGLAGVGRECQNTLESYSEILERARSAEQKSQDKAKSAKRGDSRQRDNSTEEYEAK